MNEKRPLAMLLVLGVGLLLLLAPGARAQTGGDYDLSWSTVDCGGGMSSGGVYSLAWTAGQPDAGAMQGGVYTLAGGFWSGGALAAPQYPIYLPLVMRAT